MRITKANRSGRWWKGTRTTWASKDKEGDWWIMKDRAAKGNVKKSKRCKNCSCKTSHFSWKGYILIALSILLGASLAYNLYHLL